MNLGRLTNKIYHYCTAWRYWGSSLSGNWLSRRLDKIWYPIHDFFFPYNRLTIRNCPRSYSDKDNLLFHSMFTLLCMFVENEHDDWDSTVKWYREAEEKYNLWVQNGRPDNNRPDMPEHQWRSGLVFDELYRWYNSVDWDDPVPHSPEYEKHLSSMKWTANEDGALHTITWSEDRLETTKDHIEKENRFRDLKISNMKLLCEHYESMWT